MNTSVTLTIIYSSMRKNVQAQVQSQTQALARAEEELKWEDTLHAQILNAQGQQVFFEVGDYNHSCLQSREDAA